MNITGKKIVLHLLFLLPVIAGAQPYMVDEIVGIVGKNQILYSDVENQYHQMQAQGVKPLPTKCEVFEELLIQKLLVNQAAIDSLEVDESDVDQELNQRINYFVNQIGSEQKLVAYFGKSILEIKEDMRDAVRDQLLMQKMKSQITSDISATPSEVRSFYRNLPPDSIPYIDAQVEVNQIVVYPPTSEHAIYDVKQKLLGLRQRIMNGESFATLAVLYSEGPSAPKGGDIGWATKSELDPEYAKVAFSLKKGEVSKIVHSSFGYHIIQLLDRSGDRVHTRQILLKPKISEEDQERARSKIDSIVTLVRLDSITFERAAMLFSQDKETRLNGGLLINPATGDTHFQLNQFETSEYYIIRNMKVGEISDPFQSTDDKGRMVYKVFRLKSKTPPHKANLKQDYELLKNMTLQSKQNETVNDWIEDKLKSTYVKINPPYNTCKFKLEGWYKN